MTTTGETETMTRGESEDMSPTRRTRATTTKAGTRPRTTKWTLRAVGCRAIPAMILLAAGAFAAPPVAAQAPPSGEGFGHELTLDLTVLGASVAWAGSVGERAMMGVAVGGGAPLGFTLADGELSSGRDGGPVSFVGELLHAAVFIRHRTTDAVEVEAGPRVAWMYHPDTEFETIFVGVFGGFFVQAGPLRIGPRISVGRFEEEAGRSEMNLAVVPFVGRFRLPLGGGAS